VHDNDVEGLLRHAHEASIISIVEESRKAVLADFYRSLRNEVHSAWEQQKQSIFEELGRQGTAARPSQASGSVLGSERGHTGNPVDPASMSDAAPLQARMLRYDRAIEALNTHRKRGAPFDLISALASIDADHSDTVRGLSNCPPTSLKANPA
jgi:hypothetical protein